MFSEQVKNLYKQANDRRRFSELMVCRSPVGYYLGTLYTAPEGYQEPGSRDSIYFDSPQEARNLLAKLEAGELDYTDRRMRLTP